MSKTIEEAAREYADKLISEQDFEINDEEDNYDAGSRDATYEVAPMAFTAGFNYALSLPLSERLTEEERENIKSMYKSCEISSETCTEEIDAIVAEMSLLEQIFGKEMFENSML